MITRLILLMGITIGAATTVAASGTSENEQLDFISHRSVEGGLAETSRRQREGLLAEFRASKERLEAQTGLVYGFDNYMYYLDTDSDQSPSYATSNVTRFYGTWTATGRGSSDDGALIFKLEYRTAIGNHLSTQELGPSLGYAGLFATGYSDAGLILTNLYWRQRFAGGRGSFVIGQVDNTDYVNVNNLANPWTGFTNLAFEQQSTYAGPSQGLGAAVRWRLDDNWAVLAGFTDANADPSDPLDSAQTLFDTGETFNHIAVGWTPDWSDNMDQLWQLTFWHMDEREDAGVENGHGVSFAASARIDKWRPFFRAGYADEGGAILERAVSVGLGYDARDGNDLFGIGVDWGQASGSSVDQYTMEAFYRYDPNDYLQITPSIQYVENPVNDPQTDNILVLGMRVRMFF